jgi:glycosyltransferase involved in cell wall biosynthesis
MSQPLVSIVLPTYNRAVMLPGAIKSCLDQSYENIELIVIDDGSIDNTELIVTDFADNDNRVKYFKKENEGLPKALNYGFKRTHGKYNTWTSDDNLYERDAIEIMVNALENDRHAKLVYCDYKIIDNNETVIATQKRPETEKIFEEPVVGACFLYDSACAKLVGEYDHTWLLVEDDDFFLRFASKYGIIHLKKVQPYKYRIHLESLACTKYVEVQLQKARLYASYSKHIIKKMNIFSTCYSDCSRWILDKSNRRFHAFKFALLAVFLNPFYMSHWLNLLRVIIRKRGN